MDNSDFLSRTESFANLVKADHFILPFQEMMSEWCCGFGWNNNAIAPRTRNLMNFAMLASLFNTDPNNEEIWR